MRTESKRAKRLNSRPAGVCRQAEAAWENPPVCVVLDYLGLDRNKANYKKFDSLVDWEAVDENIRKPRKLAVCQVITPKGVVMRDGKPLEVFEEVAVGKHVKELERRSKKFIRWW